MSDTERRSSDADSDHTDWPFELPPLEPYETTEGNRLGLMDAVSTMLGGIGEDASRDGLIKTPLRVAKAMMFLTKGYREDPAEIINGAIFEEDCEEMVLVKDIDFFSLCEHHLLPFFGKAHVAYIPNKKILGLSKMARIVEVFARRLQVQERLTRQIAKTLEQHLKPRGVAVVIEGQHLCMQMRGVEKQNSVAVTSSILGLFRTCADTRAEFMNLIGHPGRR
ncbi:MAG: GTP cyclohydrolase I FolE [Planctomycetota bacterium]